MSDASLRTPDAPAPRARVPMFELFVIFLKLGTLAIGGGTQAFMYRDLVEVKLILGRRLFDSSRASSASHPVTHTDCRPCHWPRCVIRAGEPWGRL